MSKHIIWASATFVAFALLCRAWAEEPNLTEATIIVQHRAIDELTRRVEDLEQNLAREIAKPCACTVPPAVGIDTKEHHEWCVTRFSKQLSGTNATTEQYDRAVAHCDFQWKVWERRDP